MEAFSVALVGVVATAAVSKLVKVLEDLDTKEKASEAVQNDAYFIKGELEFIQILMQECFDPSGRHVSRLQLVCIALLRGLAYDIEDCMDRFNPKKKNLSDFAREIANLKARSTATKDQISSNMKIAIAVNGTAQESVVGAAQGAPAVPRPRELQDLLGDKNHREWLDRNLDCLLYFCLFPCERDVSTKALMRRWLAEGLVQGEDAAVKNLEFLITASIISSTDTSNNGVSCRPTREMHASISQMSMSQNFVLLCDGTAQLPADGARRLSVHPTANGQLNLPRELSRIRTLAVFPAAGTANLANYEAALEFNRYEVLRVLDLKEGAHLSQKQLRDICGQVLMKYLSINLGSIDRIERAIGRLDQLETLDLSATGGQRCQTVTVYKEVLLLPKLKHLLGKFQLSATDTPSVPVLGWFESSLEKFLRDKSKLETMAGFVTGEILGFPQLMSLMIRLREVKIWCESNASKRNLKDLSKAITEFVRKTITEPQVHRSLSIQFEGSSEEFTKKIVSVAGKLDSLELRGKLDSLQQHGKSGPFPQFVAGLSAIVELCLWSTDLSWEVIRDGLKDVRGLKCLKLIEDNLGHVGIEPADHLKSIQRICVVCVPALDITIQAAALPHLVSLHMLCQDLHVTPGTPGGIEITHMKKLKEVTLHQQVAGGIRAEWQEALDGHTNRPLPVLLPLQGP